MKSNLHPQFNTNVTVTCLCGATYTTGSTLPEIRIEICANCHPVYTGVKRYVDTLGRVDKFMLAQKKAAKPSNSAKKDVKAGSSLPEQKSLKEMLAEAKKTV
ncbi:MAG: 50S ribosomal protein L31 [Patescibacteria group bacterium]|jgi:large subunit ribosomal protein L31|nr:MAG: 50S ribosomal protein L31 [Patescibacteria group bacterium]